jgi:arylsulfatase A-like enzyme
VKITPPVMGRIISGLLLTASVGLSAAAAPSARPNILLIISDDQGIGDFGFMGNKDLKTPNLDRLAAESAVFKNFVVGPACSPTRSSLMTGRNHMKVGVWGVGHRNNLMRDETLMPAFFKAAGYGAGYFGKPDGVALLEMKSWNRGCDEASHVTGYVHKDAVSATHLGPVQRQGWTCDVDVDTSLDYIKRMGNGPWWCATAFTLPHLPWEPDETFAKPYRDMGCSDALARCYGAIAQLDAAFGRLLEGLEKLGQADNTLVVFLSDNGPSYKELDEKEIARRNPLGLRGGKASAWDNGIRVPLMVRWPGHVKPGDRPQFATVEDVLPTMLDLAGVPPEKIPAHLPFDGISLKDAVLDPGAKEVEREVFRIAISGEGAAGGKRAFVNDPGHLPMEGQHVVLRGPRFKFHALANGTTALYDLQADPGENTDAAAQFPEIAARYAEGLRKQYAGILATGRAYRMPVVKIGKGDSGYNSIDAVMARRMDGTLRVLATGNVAGFTAPGDIVEYPVEVVQPGNYEVHIVGKNLEAVPGWNLVINNGAALPLFKSEPGRYRLGPVALEAGPATVTLSATDGAPAAKGRPELAKLMFYPTKKSP